MISSLSSGLFKDIEIIVIMHINNSSAVTLIVICDTFEIFIIFCVLKIIEISVIKVNSRVIVITKYASLYTRPPNIRKIAI